jgi:GNAT superfamily N-acetyltransferase
MRTGGDVAQEQKREADDDTAGELVIEQVTSREAADRWHEIAQEYFEADYYEMPADPVQEIYERVESTRSDDRYELWLGYLTDTDSEGGTAGTPVVLGEVRLPLLDNTANAVVNVATRPAYRRRGYGTAMLEHLTARARAQNRTRLIGDIGEPMPPTESADTSLTEPADASPTRPADASPTRPAGASPTRPADASPTSPPSSPGDASPTPPPGVLFATRAGARPVTSEVRRLLRIGDIDDARLSQLSEDAAAHTTDYSLIQWEGPAPTDVIDDLVVLHSRMTIDAPLEDLDWEPENWTPERYREREQRVVANGQVCLCTVARHDPSGQVVALTDIGLTSAQSEIAYQWATIVLPSHRGHRLGMLVKLANLEYLRTSRPHVRTLNTWNAAINDHMVGINEAIGFRAVERWREWQLELSDATN